MLFCDRLLIAFIVKALSGKRLLALHTAPHILCARSIRVHVPYVRNWQRVHSTPSAAVVVSGVGTSPMCPEAQLSFGSDPICAAYVSGQGYHSRIVEVIETTVKAAIPAHACSPLQNTPHLAGTIVVIHDSGEECPLADRILMLQSFAALAVIVVNGRDASVDELANITIPVVRLNRTVQTSLEMHLGQRGLLSIGTGPCRRSARRR